MLDRVIEGGGRISAVFYCLNKHWWGRLEFEASVCGNWRGSAGPLVWNRICEKSRSTFDVSGRVTAWSWKDSDGLFGPKQLWTTVSCAEGMLGSRGWTARSKRTTGSVFICAVTQNILRYVQHVIDGASTDKGEMDVGELDWRCSGEYCECDTSEPCRRSDFTDHSEAQINMGGFFRSQCQCSFFHVNLHR